MKVKQIYRAALFAALFSFAAIKVHAVVVYNGALANETGLCYDNTYTLDLGNSQLRNSNINSLSVQAVYSSATFSAATFNDGVASTGTITVSTTNLASLIGTRGTNTLIVSNNTNIAGIAGSVQVNVASNTYLAANHVTLTIDGNNLTSISNYTVGSSSSITAINLANAINQIGGFSATASGSTVTIACSNVGIYCNTKKIASSADTRLVPSAATFSGGVDNVYFTLNGQRFTQGIDWSRAAVSSNTAVAIQDAINNSAMVNPYFVASAALSTVTITCVSSGTACNSYTLATSSQAILPRGTALFTGGVNHAFIVINGVTLTESVDWNVSTASGTAKSISDAIRGNSVLSPIINSTWTTVATSSFGVVSATSSYVGANKNYYWASSKTSVISVSNNQMYGGADSRISTTTSKITLPNHGFTTALDVLYTKSAGTSPGTLATGTTYFVIPVDANTIKLAATSAAAVAGTPVVAITTQTATGGGSFTLTPLAYSGTPSFKWQSSNDGSHWDDIAVSSVTVNTPTNPPSSTSWDFGSIGWRYIRANVVAPTRGGLYLLITGVGKSSE